MGLFDGLTKNAYRKDSQGRKVYYPLGLRRSGYIVPDDGTERAINRTTLWTLIGGIIVALIVRKTLGTWEGLAAAALVIAIAGIRLALILRSLEPSDEQIDPTAIKAIARQRHIANLHALPSWFLVATLLCGLAFVGGGIFLLPVVSSEDVEGLLALLGAWVIGLGFLAYFGYAVYVLATTERPEVDGSGS